MEHGLSGTQSKKSKGQFYTTTNPFHNQLFIKWFNSIPMAVKEERPFLEPFAGANNIVQMMLDLSHKNKWECFDIDPNPDAKTPFVVLRRDTLQDFPSGYRIAITNPPYLAKNSATRDGLAFPDCEFDDLYKFALGVMLGKVDYVAAIVPESFVTSSLFHDRLYGIATLTCRMFDDTECPVCLALFVPKGTKTQEDDFVYYKGNSEVGTYKALKKAVPLQAMTSNPWKFNKPDGEIGLYAVDGTKSKSIRFVKGSEIPSTQIKTSSRSVTKIGGLPKGLSADEVIKEANIILRSFRSTTEDVFLTSFKGLREDGDYRRRLDFSMARQVLNLSVEKIRARSV